MLAISARKIRANGSSYFTLSVVSFGDAFFGHENDLGPDSTIDEMGKQPEDGLSSFLVESLQALESAVDGLYRLGVAIRHSSSGNLTHRINAFVKKNDDGMLEAMAYIHLKHKLVDKVVMDAVGSSSKNPEPPGAALSLCRQLAVAVSFRYFGILYRRSHAKKMEVARRPSPRVEAPRESPSSEIESNDLTQDITLHKSKRTLPTAAKPSAIPARLRPRVPLSDTEPSIPESKLVRKVFASPAEAIRTAPSVISILPKNVKYPDPPTRDSSARDQECPYCCQKFPRAQFENKMWWE
jgi:hypothetical protein